MKSISKTTLLGVVAALAMTSAAAVSVAQVGPPGGGFGPPRGEQGHDQGKRGGGMRGDPAQREQAMRQRLAIQPNQEAAFKAFLAATQPPADRGRPDRQEMQGLTTPQRLDRQLVELRQREAELVKRIDATKKLYAVLNAEQRQTLDAAPMGGGRGGPGGPGGRRGRGGPGFDGPGFPGQ